ncbi:MAG TPA: CAP-Gly protein, partial [Erwinia persicina]|nr:CAP-Gly protein [Erwinia persicina]
MELKNELALTKRVSWGSIIAGVVTAMAISLLLTMLGTSLGLSMLSPKSDDIVNGGDTSSG